MYIPKLFQTFCFSIPNLLTGFRDKIPFLSTPKLVYLSTFRLYRTASSSKIIFIVHNISRLINSSLNEGRKRKDRYVVGRAIRRCIHAIKFFGVLLFDSLASTISLEQEVWRKKNVVPKVAFQLFPSVRNASAARSRRK